MHGRMKKASSPQKEKSPHKSPQKEKANSSPLEAKHVQEKETKSPRVL